MHPNECGRKREKEETGKRKEEGQEGRMELEAGTEK